MAGCNAVVNPIVLGFKLDKIPTSMAVDRTLYMQMVGSLTYLTSTRPDIVILCLLLVCSVGIWHILQKFISKLLREYSIISRGHLHMEFFINKLVTRSFLPTPIVIMQATGKIGKVHRVLFSLSSGAVSWSSKKQPVVTLSTTKAEFIAAAAYVF